MSTPTPKLRGSRPLTLVANFISRTNFPATGSVQSSSLAGSEECHLPHREGQGEATAIGLQSMKLMTWETLGFTSIVRQEGRL
ncbi:hypothetical protein BHM03_00003598 [Ensete ventricosum]|nr:hypothetical protein BHM03_00003598 [Ensete ventricosum]